MNYYVDGGVTPLNANDLEERAKHLDALADYIDKEAIQFWKDVHNAYNDGKNPSKFVWEVMHRLDRMTE